MGKYAGFNSVQLRKPQKSSFDPSHQKRMSARGGELFPVYVQETVPGDHFSGSSEILIRLAPLLSPIYDQIFLVVHFFFIAYRTVWEDWETFITGGRLGVGIDPLEAPIPPWIAIGEFVPETPLLDKNSLADYFGIPVTVIAVEPDYGQIPLDILPFACYQFVWYEYYRDRNFVADDVLEFPLISGKYDVTDGSPYLGIRVVDYNKDYYTSALPFTQRGTEVLIPVDSAAVYRDQTIVRHAGDGSPVVSADFLMTGPTGGAEADFSGSENPVRFDNILSISNISATIEDLRVAYALQVWFERNAVAGSRYTESIQAHFAVKPQDYRLQRPEYIGGGRIMVDTQEVVTSAYSQNEDDATVPAGNLNGYGRAYGNTNQFNYFCSEHGLIIGIAHIVTEGSYHQGMPPMFYKRRSFLDYPWPTFAKLGEQPIDKAELYASVANMTLTDGERPLFGYQSRYADWKWIPNTSHCEFHDTLMFWTTTRDFASSPELGTQFLQYDGATQDRLFAVSGYHNFWLYVFNHVKLTRALPYFGTPNTLGFS